MDLGSKEMTNNLENLACIECYADYSHCLFSDWLVEWLGRREAVIVQQGAGWVQEWAVTLTRGWHAIKLSGHSSSGLQFWLWSSILWCIHNIWIWGHSQMTSQHWTTNGNLKSWQKMTGGGTKGHQKRWWMMKNLAIQGNSSKKAIAGLTRLHWTPFGANGWLM